jgi:hypothetical protein
LTTSSAIINQNFDNGDQGTTTITLREVIAEAEETIDQLAIELNLTETNSQSTSTLTPSILDSSTQHQAAPVELQNAKFMKQFMLEGRKLESHKVSPLLNAGDDESALLENEMAFYFVNTSFSGAQIQLTYALVGDEPVRVDKQQCPVAVNDECMRTHDEVFNTIGGHIVVRINRRQIGSNGLTLHLRQVISGCDPTTLIRDFDYISHINQTFMPLIHHNSSIECTYRVRLPADNSSLFSVNMELPPDYNRTCRALVQIASSNDASDPFGVVQAQFEYLKEVEEFGFNVYLAGRFALIRLINCIENKRPILVALTQTRGASHSVQLNATSPTYSFASKTLISPRNDKVLLVKASIKDPRDRLLFKLNDYETKEDAKPGCVSFASESMFTVYGIDQSNRFIWRHYKSCGFKMDSFFTQHGLEWRYVKDLFFQFSRKEIIDPSKVHEIDASITMRNVTKHYQVLKLDSSSDKLIFNSQMLNELRNNTSDRLEHIDLEFQAPSGSRIKLSLNSFTADSCAGNMTSVMNDSCSYKCMNEANYAIVRLNKTTTLTKAIRARSLIEPLNSPIVCATDENFTPIDYYSYSNSLVLTFSLASSELSSIVLIPSFAIAYNHESICNNVYKEPAHAMIAYSSLKSLTSANATGCGNSIQVAKNRRIVLYKHSWLKDTNSAQRLDSQSDESNDNNQFVQHHTNGYSICKGAHTLLISEVQPKYREMLLDSSPSAEKNSILPERLPYTYYCLRNPLDVYISQGTKLYINYTVHSSESIRSTPKPLAFELGYFSYKYMFGRGEAINFDASQLPSAVPDTVLVDMLEYIVRVPDDYYVVPIIYSCSSGNLSSIGEEASISSANNENEKCSFGKQCSSGLSYSLMSSMSSEYRVQLKGLRLAALRITQASFLIKYTTLPRVMRDPAGGSFESNKYQRQYMACTREAEYTWRIELSDERMIKLRVDKLLNVDQQLIMELTFRDGRGNGNSPIIYDTSEIIDNYLNPALKQHTYLFATSRLIITFRHKQHANVQQRNSSALPYVSFSYTSEPRIIETHANAIGELTLEKVLLKNRISWRINSPVDTLVVAKIAESAGTSSSQLKFTMLGNGYNDNGVYHYQLKQQKDENSNTSNNNNNNNNNNAYDRPTDIVVSKENALSIEFERGSVNDSFRIVYSNVPLVLNERSGVVTQLYNELVTPVVRVPRMTDQTWLIRAPREKRIQLYLSHVNMLDEKPCVKSALSVHEPIDNLTAALSLCGKAFSKIDDSSLSVSSTMLQSNKLITSKSNELFLRFVTHDVNEVIYLDEQLSPDGSSAIEPYTGFKLYYARVEAAGDCSFQMRDEPYCDYKKLSHTLPWLIDEEDDENSMRKATSRSQMIIRDKRFNQLFCTRCYASATITNKNDSPNDNVHVLMTPVIDKDKRFVKFLYRFSPTMMTSADGRRQVTSNSFRVRLVNAAPTSAGLSALLQQTKFTDKLLDESSTVIAKLPASLRWRQAVIRIPNENARDFQLLFTLSKNGVNTKAQVDKDDNDDADDEQQFIDMIPTVDAEQSGRQMPTVSLDDIDFYERSEECTSSPNLICVDGAKLYRRHARAVFDTSSCTLNSRKCLNGATCLNKQSLEKTQDTTSDADSESFVCLCESGFTGKRCEARLDPCALNKCSNHSRCISSSGEESPSSYKCICDEQYHGEHCEHKYSPCKAANNLCNRLNGQGECVDMGTRETPNLFACKCMPMYTGSNCETKLKSSCSTSNECNVEDKNATCIQLDDEIVCKCSPGFGGKACTNIDDCAAAPCLNGGQCKDGINSFTCKCPEPYTGKYCERSKHCDKCDKTGTAVCDSSSGDTASKCLCHPTHTGRLCETVLDKCTSVNADAGANSNSDSDLSPCRNGATCVGDRMGNFSCICAPGFVGPLCQQKETSCDKKPCQNGATCQMLQNGKDSSDHSMLIMLTNEHHDVKDKGNNEQDYECKCAPGYNGTHCERRINICHHLDPCQNGGTCVPSFMSRWGFRCTCDVGFTGAHCERKLDYCAQAKCSPDSECLNTDSGYICDCLGKFAGRYCNETLDHCINNECKSGKCVVDELTDSGEGEEEAGKRRKYRCECPAGYTGELCETRMSQCEPGTCENGAECLDIQSGSFKCICKSGYTGDRCQHLVNYCSAKETECDMNGYVQCTQYVGGRKCHCRSRFIGDRCEQSIDYCAFYKPCRGRGECLTLREGADYTCKSCARGFAGKNCSEPYDFCERDKPCKNGAKCHLMLGSYYCECAEGYTGASCDTKLSAQCMHNKCKNNATCVAIDEHQFKCLCDANFEGTYCQTRKVQSSLGVDQSKDLKCLEKKCENGAQCVRVTGTNNRTKEVCLCFSGLTVRMPLKTKSFN